MRTNDEDQPGPSCSHELRKSFSLIKFRSATCCRISTYSSHKDARITEYVRIYLLDVITLGFPTD
jgi:hypothetical protein